MSEIDAFDELLAAAQAGEQWAVAVLFRELQPRLLRFLGAQEPRAADDLAAEVWEAIARSIGRFEGDWPGFRAWVFTIARRRLIEYRRRAVRRRTDVADDTDFATVAAPDAPEQDALARLSAKEAAAMVCSVLPRDQADVVLLRVLGDLDVAQVAAILDRTENWVRVNQHRALRKLAERHASKLGVTR